MFGARYAYKLAVGRVSSLPLTTWIMDPGYLPYNIPAMASIGRYKILAGETVVEDTIQRSRFIATLAPTPTVDEAKSFIARVRETYSDASHNCWAYLVGSPGSSANIGLSDDGEPHGTAGRPMLNILTHSGVGDLSVVVTRYFGGVKLGKGGLVRAYSGAVKLALEQATLTEKVEWVNLLVEIDYPWLDSLKRSMPDFEAAIISEVFTEKVALDIRLPEEHEQAFREAVSELSNGSAAITRVKAGDTDG